MVEIIVGGVVDKISAYLYSLCVLIEVKLVLFR